MILSLVGKFQYAGKADMDTSFNFGICCEAADIHIQLDAIFIIDHRETIFVCFLTHEHMIIVVHICHRREFLRQWNNVIVCKAGTDSCLKHRQIYS